MGAIKRLPESLRWILLCISALLVLCVLYDNRLHREKNLHEPNDMGNYSEIGYYRIKPDTILKDLAKGESGAFEPYFGDPNDLDELIGLTIRWTQDDILKIASAVGEFAWNDPMDLHKWSIYSISLLSYCKEPSGFDYASIAYYKDEPFTYTARLITILPYFGLVKYGDGSVYSKPVFRKWKRVDLLNATVSADDAIQIVKDDMKKRFNTTESEVCGILISSPMNNDAKNWYLELFSGLYVVDLKTGEYTFRQRR